jgi:hypothetical protein
MTVRDTRNHALHDDNLTHDSKRQYKARSAQGTMKHALTVHQGNDSGGSSKPLCTTVATMSRLVGYMLGSLVKIPTAMSIIVCFRRSWSNTRALYLPTNSLNSWSSSSESWGRPFCHLFALAMYACACFTRSVPSLRLLAAAPLLPLQPLLPCGPDRTPI